MSFQPGRVAGLDQLGEMIAVALGVHAAPETLMLVDVQLAVARQLDQRIALQHAAFILGQAFQKIALEKKETAVDPVAFEVGFLREFNHPVAIHFDFAETRRRVDAEDGAEFFPGEMMLKCLREIGVGQAVAVSHGKMFCLAEIFARGLGDAAAGHVFLAGVGERDFPIELVPMLVDSHLVGLELDGAVGVVQVEVAEIILHNLRLETEAQYKTAKTMPRVNLHDVPENRMFTDGPHRLGAEFSFFLDARAEAAAQDENRDVGRFVHDGLPMIKRTRAKSSLDGVPGAYASGVWFAASRRKLSNYHFLLNVCRRR